MGGKGKCWLHGLRCRRRIDASLIRRARRGDFPRACDAAAAQEGAARMFLRLADLASADGR